MASKTPATSLTLWLNGMVIIASVLTAAFMALPKEWQEAPWVAGIMGVVNLILRFKTGFSR